MYREEKVYNKDITRNRRESMETEQGSEGSSMETSMVLKGKFFCKVKPVAEMMKSASMNSPLFI